MGLGLFYELIFKECLYQFRFLKEKITFSSKKTGVG